MYLLVPFSCWVTHKRGILLSIWISCTQRVAQIFSQLPQLILIWHPCGHDGDVRYGRYTAGLERCFVHAAAEKASTVPTNLFEGRRLTPGNLWTEE
jgi:hypothetical protein